MLVNTVMATLSSPLTRPLPLPHLDASPTSTSPTPALTPSPAATSPSSQPASRSLPESAAGRDKAQRWSRDTQPSGKSGGGQPNFTFKEALLKAFPAAPVRPVVSPARPAVSPAATRILLRPEDSRPPSPRRGPDSEGWQEAVSRRSRKNRLREGQRPFCRRVPADLRGLCFNCFSPEHRAATCNLQPRCFRCRRLGHRAAWCCGSARSMADSRPMAGLVLWSGVARMPALPPPVGVMGLAALLPRFLLLPVMRMLADLRRTWCTVLERAGVIVEGGGVPGDVATVAGCPSLR